MRRISKRRARSYLLVAAVACLALVGAGEAGAAKAIAVDCTANPNALTGAIADAKKGATLSITGTCNGTFEIAKDLTLVGTGDGATLDGQQAGTVLTVDSGTKVDVSNLTITKGLSTAFTAIGGIHNMGALSLTKCAVLSNSAGPGSAPNPTFFAIGGIYNDGGTLALTNCSVNSNDGSVGTGLAFGGILNEGPMTITGGSVTGNSATASTSPGTSAARAGIENGVTLTITNSTVAGNTASARNATGGILNVPTGALTLTSTIVVLNNAIADGGAVGGLANAGGQVTIGGAALRAL
jgi:fibronectin-binding autotransporter adhesin